MTKAERQEAERAGYQRGYADGINAARTHLAMLVARLDEAFDLELEEDEPLPALPADEAKERKQVELFAEAPNA